MKNIMIIAIALFATISFAQKKERTLKVNKDTNLIEVVYYHDNGEVSQTGTYTLDGKLQGQWVSYNKEGDKTIVANYDNGKKSGKWFYYTDNGTVKEVDYSKNVIASLKETDLKANEDF
ncbi:toxin-antitoxin system YwqK family antitoxin [Yeosuana marina]|uniref:toxin-antitoxin system YwqK family antitoxin n=1 Tax=Yeosuana marina TaxID=1565536 RepID=UPI001423C507|nr:nicotinic acid mononucleotide adenyltransferase [Yeosuana marina]